MPLSTTRLLRKLSCKLTLLSTTLANRCIQKGYPSRPVFRMMNMTVACFATEIGAKKRMLFQNDASAVSFQHSLYKNTSVVICKHSARVHVVRNRLQNRMQHLSKGIIPLVWTVSWCSHWSLWRQPMADVIKNLFSWRQPMADVIKNLFSWRQPMADVIKNLFSWRQPMADVTRHSFFMTSEKVLQNFNKLTK